MQLELLEAERFDGDAEGGATVPARMACRRGEALVDVYVKFSSPMCSPTSLCRDLVGCLLAKQLGIHVGEPVLVEVDDLLIESIRPVSPSSSARMRQAIRPAFGSISLGTGYVQCRGIDPADEPLAEKGTEVWAFDQLILNPDRNTRKPNCLCKDGSLAVIDHEKSLVIYGMGTLFAPPWGDRWTSDQGHLFHDLVRSTHHSLGRLKVAWEGLTVSVFDEILETIPLTWKSAEPDALDIAFEYLRSLQENIGRAFFNLERARV